MASPWDLQIGDISSLSAGGSSMLQPPLKYFRSEASGSRARAPAMPVLQSSRVQETAEGNLVHANKELDSVSDISIVSSTRAKLINANIELQRCLLQEAKEQSKLARLRIEAMQEDEPQALNNITGMNESSHHLVYADDRRH